MSIGNSATLSSKERRSGRLRIVGVKVRVDFGCYAIEIERAEDGGDRCAEKEERQNQDDRRGHLEKAIDPDRAQRREMRQAVFDAGEQQNEQQGRKQKGAQNDADKVAIE
jgi:hypothetical protein